MTSAPITTDAVAAADALRRGGLVAFPTETVYGLGADASSDAAVARIFAAKGRPLGHPLIVHLADAAAMPAWVAPTIGANTRRRLEVLAATFWPGPLTIVVPRSDHVAAAAVGGRPTVGLRVPDHPMALDLLTAFGGGVAAPSANRFGAVSPTTAEHVRRDLGSEVDVILDGGPTGVGVESTIIELVDEPTLLRPGGVTRDELASALGEPVHDGQAGPSRAPGMLASHYAPNAGVELVTAADLDNRLADLDAATAVIAPFAVEHRPSWTLPAHADGYARHLYATLRAVDDAGATAVLIVAPEEGRLLDAVLDRLAKAAGPRPGRKAGQASPTNQAGQTN
ncbi:MAG: L-threonylcarbamoyladenylate synthase [Actinomycetota bacterium]